VEAPRVKEVQQAQGERSQLARRPDLQLEVPRLHTHAAVQALLVE